MKNIYKSFALLCMGLAATACIEENFENNGPKYDTTPGNEIVFSATAGIENGDKKTRTVYGDQDDPTAAKGWIEINWVNDDMIAITSPQSGGPKVGHYKVTGANQDKPETTDKNEADDFNSTHAAASLTRLGDGGLQWSEETKYTFYAAYPSFKYDVDKSHGATATLTEDGVLTGSMPIEQTYKAVKPHTDAAGKAGFIVEPEMRYSFMTAKSTYSKYKEDGKTPNDQAIDLQFESMVTALQFDITANTINIPTESVTSMEIVSVALLSGKSKISGDFTYDIKNGAYTAGTSGTNRVTIHFDGDDQKSLASNGGFLNVTFFVLPGAEGIPAGDLQLQILFKLGNTQMSRLATIGKALEGGKKYIFNDVLLPKFEGDVPPSSWWDTLDPNTILPQVSIPMASNVFANYAYGVEEQYQQQQMTIEQLWQMGVRGFEICTQSASTGSNFNTNMNQSLASQKFQVAENPITPTGSGAPQNFGQAFEDLYELLTREGSENECLIILCTYMSQNDGYSPLIYVNNLFNYLTEFCQSKNITDYSTRFKQITSNVTVGEMRGKIAIVIRPGDDDRWRYQYDEAGYTDPYETLFNSVPAIDPANPIALTAEIKNRLSTSEWWNYVLMVSDWGTASFDRWDRRYGKKYASAATFNIKNVAKKTESQKLYIEDYLYGVSSTNNQTLGSPNGTYEWAGGSTNNFNGRFNETPPLFPSPQTFDFEHSMSNGSKAYIQEWMRVVDEGVRIPVAYKTNGGSQTLWVDWPSSIGEKKTAIKDLFNLSVKTQGKPLTDLYINVLTGYYVDYGTNGVSRPGTFPQKDPMDGFTGDVDNIGSWWDENNGNVTGHGKGGDFLGLSKDLNSYVYDLLSAEPGSSNGLSHVGPWGLVMLDNIKANDVSADLVELIMMNNFKFDLVTSESMRTTPSYNATYSNGGEAISFK